MTGAASSAARYTCVRMCWVREKVEDETPVRGWLWLF